VRTVITWPQGQARDIKSILKRIIKKDKEKREGKGEKKR
jgi:hypothetical protein